MQPILAIAWNEARMARRNWRVWLLTSLVLAIGLFARSNYLSHIEGGYYLLPAYSFWHPSFYLLLLILGLGTVAVGLDLCGRLARTGMHQIMYPMPVHSLALTLGRFVAVLIILLPIALLGFVLLATFQYRLGHSPVVFQPFIWAFLFYVIPFIVPLAAATILIRTVFKHDFAAILVLLGSFAALMILNSLAPFLIPLQEVHSLMLNASPNLGVRIIPEKYWGELFAHGLITVLCLVLAPLYIRRQEPQRSIIKRGKRYNWFAIPTLIRWVTDMRIDPQLGWAYRSVLVLSIVLCAGGWWFTYQQATSRSHPASNDIEKLFMREMVTLPHIDVDTLAYEMFPGTETGSLNFISRIEGTLKDETDTLYLDLSGEMTIDAARVNGAVVTVEQWNRVRRLSLDYTLETDSPLTIEVDYHTPRYFKHPSAVEIRGNQFAAPLNEIYVAGDWVAEYTDKFQAQVAVHLSDDQTLAFAGTHLGTDEIATGRVERWRTDLPVSYLEVNWGHYEMIEKTDRVVPVRFYHLPNHRYQTEVYLEEVLDQEEIVREELGTMPFPLMIFVEKPYVSAYQWQSPFRPLSEWWRPFYRDYNQETMPGLIRIPENTLAFMNRSIWRLDRFDLDPESVPFYRHLDDARDQLNEQYYEELIRLYYRETLNPVGDYAFWLDYLPDYATALLERNRWRRRYALNYTIEGSLGEPISLARNLSLKELSETPEGQNILRKRALGNFRMLHSLMGDDTWWNFQRTLIHRYAFEPITMEEFISLAEDFYGESLDWFVEDWIKSPSLPEYEITLAEARLVEDPLTDEITYEVSLQVKNHGTGRMKLPVYIETEMDFFYADVWLDSGVEETTRVTMPHRPQLAVVDPLNWVLKIDYFDPNLKRRTRSEKKIEMISSNQRPTAQVERRGRRR